MVVSNDRDGLHPSHKTPEMWIQTDQSWPIFLQAKRFRVNRFRIEHLVCLHPNSSRKSVQPLSLRTFPRNHFVRLFETISGLLPFT